jgi:hypothetical protein
MRTKGLVEGKMRTGLSFPMGLRGNPSPSHDLPYKTYLTDQIVRHPQLLNKPTFSQIPFSPHIFVLLESSSSFKSFNPVLANA